MKADPVVAEVRKVRAQIERECGHDVARLFDRLRQGLPQPAPGGQPPKKVRQRRRSLPR